MTTERVTMLWAERPILNRLSWWLYNKYCREPYVPKGRIRATVTIGNPKCLGFDGRYNSVKISFVPDEFVPGVHELTISDVAVVDLRSK